MWVSRIGWIAVAMLWSTFAFAMQTVQVGPSGAIVFGDPKPDSAMTGTLRPGQSVRVDDEPVGGYFRIAVGRKYVGWVQQTALDLPRNEPPPSAVSRTAVPSAPAAPREPPTSYVGLFGGLGLAGSGSSLGFGLDGGYKLSKYWNLGMYFQYLTLAATDLSRSQVEDTSGSNSLAAASGKSSLVLAALELNFNIARVPGLYVGAKAGLGMAIATTTSTSTSATAGSGSALAPVLQQTDANTTSFSLAGGIAAGYFYPVYQQMVSVGAEGSFLLLTGDVATNIINFMASVRFVF